MAQSIEVSLVNEQDQLWEQFYAVGAEMRATKAERPLFPRLEYETKDLVPEKHYALTIHLEPVDNHCYSFKNGKWTVNKKLNKKPVETQKVFHPDGVQTGKYWMSGTISFRKIRITKSSNQPDMLLVDAMHKYIPVLSIYEIQSNQPSLLEIFRPIASIKIAHTEFIPVGRYMNRALVDLKTSTNKRAERFRIGGARQQKRASNDGNSSDVTSPQPKKTRTANSPLMASVSSNAQIVPLAQMSPVTPLVQHAPVAQMASLSPLAPVASLAQQAPATPLAPRAPMAPVAPATSLAPRSPLAQQAQQAPVTPMAPFFQMAPMFPMASMFPMYPATPNVFPVILPPLTPLNPMLSNPYITPLFPGNIGNMPTFPVGFQYNVLGMAIPTYPTPPPSIPKNEN